MSTSEVDFGRVRGRVGRGRQGERRAQADGGTANKHHYAWRSRPLGRAHRHLSAAFRPALIAEAGQGPFPGRRAVRDLGRRRALYWVSFHERPNGCYLGIRVEVGAKDEEIVDTAPTALAFDGRTSPSQVSSGAVPRSRHRQPCRDVTSFRSRPRPGHPGARQRRSASSRTLAD